MAGEVRGLTGLGWLAAILDVFLAGVALEGEDEVEDDRVSAAKPRISVITPCMDRQALIGETVESVVAQEYPDVEHIIVDGGSTDGTLETLSRYPHLRVISGPDTGPFDALNKGIGIASGKIVCILNSDDVYPPGTLHRVASAFSVGDADIVVGRAAFFLSRNGEIGPELDEIGEYPADHLTLETVLWDAPMIEGRFLNARVYERIGRYDARYRLGADLDFVIRLALAEVSTEYLDEVVYLYRRHPGSLTNDPSVGAIRATTAPLYAERLALMERFLKDPSITPQAKRIIRRWHSIQSCRATSVALLEGRYVDALGVSARGWGYDAMFPLVFMRHFAPRIGKVSRLRRK
jgi:glycosyltransferase involved in cell wall biosynthesis